MQDQASCREFHSSSKRPKRSRFFLSVCRGSGFSLVLLLFVSLPLALSDGQLAGNSAFLGPPVLTVNKQVQEVDLILTVRNRWGHFVHDLKEDDLSILDNDQPPEKITYFQPQTDLPLRVALLIDISSSITDRFRFEQKAAAAFLRRVLRHGSDLALVIGFNEEIQLAQHPSEDPDLLARAVKELRPGGETALYDAVSVACSQLMNIKDKQPTRRVIILITDGEDNRSHIDLQHAVESALRAETLVYVLSTNPAYRTEGGDRSMKELAEATGGHLLRADDDVTSAFSKLAEELRSQYAIGYKPSNKGPDGLFHRLIVSSPKKFHIYHRLGYFAP